MDTAYTCPIRVNGFGLLVTVYGTTDRGMLPEHHRATADPTGDGEGLFVVEHAHGLDEGSPGPSVNGSAVRRSSVSETPAN